MAQKISTHNLANFKNFRAVILVINLFAVTIVIHRSRNLIGTLGSSEFGPKIGSGFSEQCYESRSANIKAKSTEKHRPPSHKSSGVAVLSIVLSWYSCKRITVNVGFEILF